MTAIGVRVGAGGGPGALQPPQILGNSYFLGSKKKFWQSQVLKPFPRCLFYYFEEINIFYFNLKKSCIRHNYPVTFSRDSGCLARDEFLFIREGYHMLTYISII